MPITTVFTKSFLQTKKNQRLKLLFFFLRAIIVNNLKPFLINSFLVIIVALINFNIGVIVKDAFSPSPPSQSFVNKIADEIEKKRNEGTTIEKNWIKRIWDENKDDTTRRLEELKDKFIERNEELSDEEIKELIKDLRKTNLFDAIFEKKYKFSPNIFGLKPLEEICSDLHVLTFASLILIFIITLKAFFSIKHRYLMGYAYDAIERDLKKDLFCHFVRAKYPSGAEVAPNLVTQFATDLDIIVDHIWYIPNRLIYLITTIFLHVKWDLNFGGEKINWQFVWIMTTLFGFTALVRVISLKKITELDIKNKKRIERDNKTIFERINNLEYIKAVSGENYEEEKINHQLDATFQKNNKSLFLLTLLKSIPDYLLIPSNPFFFIFVILFKVRSEEEKAQPYFLAVNFLRYYFVAQKLNTETGRVLESLMSLDELSSSLLMVKENVNALSQPELLTQPIPEIHQWENGDISFEEVIFAYPQRPQENILRNFSFSFQQGKSYGVAGSNGIGKSTITKNILKLYSPQGGKILVGGHNIQEIDNVSLHERICYQTNRPGFFRLSLAENVFYPQKYRKKDLKKLIWAAKKVGIYEFIEKLPNQFQTILKEEGKGLSEGQKQQIAAIRIFIRDYDVYILDEILSNVHPVLKKVILQNIFQQIKGKTVITIDHHYEIFQYVDYVYQFTGERLTLISS